MHYLTSLAKEEEAHATTPAPAEPLVQPAPQPEAEPVSSTFIMDQDGQQRSTERTQQETPSAEPEPQPQIEPDTPAPHPETPPTPEPTPAPQPAPAQEPEPEPEIIPLPEPDIAQPLPDMALPPDIARPMPEPAHTTPTTDALKPIIIQAVVLAQLTITAPSMPEPQVFTLTRTKTTLGRAGSNDILLDKDTLTSRRHAYICREDDQYIIYDDDSIHGIIVNEQKLEPGASHQLTDGDHIRIGEHELIFHMKVPQYISSEQQTSGEHILS